MGRFKPGQSGNPSGKRPGTRHASTKVREGLLQSVDVSALIKKLSEQALAGDTQAAGLLMARLVPTLRPVTPTIRLELDGESLVQQAESILKHVAAGSVPPDVASDLLGGLVAIARLKEVTEFGDRLAALEAQLPSKGAKK